MLWSYILAPGFHGMPCRGELDGLPATALGMAAQSATREGHVEATAESGPWLLTLDFPCYQPVMSHAKSRGLREELYRCARPPMARVTILLAAGRRGARREPHQKCLLAV